MSLLFVGFALGLGTAQLCRWAVNGLIQWRFNRMVASYDGYSVGVVALPTRGARRVGCELYTGGEVEAALVAVLLDDPDLDVDERRDRRSIVDDVLAALPADLPSPEHFMIRTTIARFFRAAATHLELNGPLVSAVLQFEGTSSSEGHVQLKGDCRADLVVETVELVGLGDVDVTSISVHKGDLYRGPRVGVDLTPTLDVGGVRLTPGTEMWLFGRMRRASSSEENVTVRLVVRGRRAG